jgi:hypothetical protein
MIPPPAGDESAGRFLFHQMPPHWSGAEFHPVFRHR